MKKKIINQINNLLKVTKMMTKKMTLMKVKMMEKEKEKKRKQV